jgi:putative spermidine/putrescine transport system permease protein
VTASTFTVPRGETSLRQRLVQRGVTPRLFLLCPAVAFAIALFIYPFIYGFGLSLTTTGGGPLGNYVHFFRDGYFARTIWYTLRLALPAVVVNIVIALPLSLGMRRMVRGRQTVTAVLLFPITAGSVLLSKGMLNFFGTSGWVNRILLAAHVIDQPVQFVHNYWGVFISIVLSDFPFVFLLLLSYAGGFDPVFENAAAVFGARRLQRFRYVTLPLLAPGLATTASLAFVLAFGVFPSAMLVGDPAGSTRTMAVAAYQEAFQQFNYPMGSTVAMLMAAIEIVVIVGFLALRARLVPTVAGGRKG